MKARKGTGSIVRKGTALYIVYDAGKKWSKDKGEWVRDQRWERVESGLRRDAEALLRERQTQASGGTHRRARTFKELAEAWLASTTHQVRAQSADRYAMLLQNHILPALGHLRLEQITPGHVEALKNELLTHGLAVSTTKSVLGQVKTIFRYGMQFEGLLRNPAEIKHKFRDDEEAEEVEYLTPDEVARLLAHTPEEWRPFFITAIWTGMRVGELQAARWANLDTEKATYTVRETLTRQHGFGPPKASKAAPVYLSPRVLAALERQRAIVAQMKLAAGPDWQDHDLLFPTRVGTPHTYQVVAHRVFKKILRAAGLQDIRFHVLRHTCASLNISNGANIKFVQQQLRHAKINETLDTYGHLLPETFDVEARRLDALIPAAV